VRLPQLEYEIRNDRDMRLPQLEYEIRNDEEKRGNLVLIWEGGEC
jgi:hypothetical protein